MINVTFTKRNHLWQSFEMSGHAGFAEHGYDIVCAAVSVLATNTVNSIEALVNILPIVDVDDEQGGYLYCELPTELLPNQENDAQVLLNSLYLGMNAIQNEYADYIRLQEIDTSNQ